MLFRSENLERIGLTAKIICADAADRESWWQGEFFDHILLDAPCSATGVIRRHPDIKLLRRESDIAQLTALQSNILDSLWACLRPGGRLTYVTCSILPAENTEQIEAFVARQADARTETLNVLWGEDTGWGRQVLPEIDGGDGFFFASVVKDLHSAD